MRHVGACLVFVLPSNFFSPSWRASKVFWMMSTSLFVTYLREQVRARILSVSEWSPCAPSFSLETSLKASMRKLASLDDGGPSFLSLLFVTCSKQQAPNGLSRWCFRFLYTDFVNKLCLLLLRGAWLMFFTIEWEIPRDPYLFSFRGREKDI